MPWIAGFEVAAATDNTQPGSDPRAARLAGGDGDYGKLGLRADLEGTGAQNIIVASALGDLVIADAAGHVLARSPAPRSEGSADDLIALAVGDGELEGAPLVLVATQRGGHRINTVSIAVYRMRARSLQRLFEAPVEVHDGDVTTTGSLTFGPATLAYRAPGAGTLTTWVFDSNRRRYVPR